MKPLRRAAAVGLVAWCVATGVLGAAGAASSSLYPPTPNGYYPAPSVAENDQPGIYRNGCHLSVDPIVPVACTNGQPTVSPITAPGVKTVALFGDSHAVQWFAAVQRVAAINSWRMLSITKTHCPVESLNVALYMIDARYTQCSPWRTNVLRGIRQHTWGPIDVLVIGSYSNHVLYTTASGPRVRVTDTATAYAAGLRTTLKSIAGSVGQIVILRDTPDLPGNRSSFDYCMRENFRNANVCGGPTNRAINYAVARAERAVVAEFPNVRFINLTTDLCPNGYCLTVLDGIRIYKDDNHLTQTFALRRMVPLLKPVLADAMTRATTPPATPSS